MDADAIVIGAGAAGLSAARLLARRSLRVLVLEARDRIGGRVWPVPVPASALPAELGAEFIHGPAKETMALLRAAGVEAIATGGDSWAFCEGELRPTQDDIFSAAGIFEHARLLATDVSVADFLRGFDGDPSMRQTVASALAFAEGFDAADPSLASAHAIADEWRSGVDFQSSRPATGYAPVLDQLYGDCLAAGVRTDLSSTVRRIWQRGDVRVHVASDASPRTLHARSVIVTLPIGVLEQREGENAVRFDPDLPPEKRAAIAGIRMGDAVKVTLHFRTPFWEHLRDGRYRGASFFRCAQQPFPAYWVRRAAGDALVAAWAGGPKATALSGVARDELTALALCGFGALFDASEIAQREFAGAFMHDWSGDPFARGAYSYVLTGATQARATLAAPLEGTLFFAGEATSVDGQGGTVNGALETGERAAREAAAALERTVSKRD